MKSKKVVVCMTEKMFEDLRTNRVATGVPTNEFIRRAINLTLHVDQNARVEKRAVSVEK